MRALCISFCSRHSSKTLCRCRFSLAALARKVQNPSNVHVADLASDHTLRAIQRDGRNLPGYQQATIRSRPKPAHCNIRSQIPHCLRLAYLLTCLQRFTSIRNLGIASNSTYDVISVHQRTGELKAGCDILFFERRVLMENFLNSFTGAVHPGQSFRRTTNTEHGACAVTA